MLLWKINCKFVQLDNIKEHLLKLRGGYGNALGDYKSWNWNDIGMILSDILLIRSEVSGATSDTNKRKKIK